MLKINDVIIDNPNFVQEKPQKVDYDKLKLVNVDIYGSYSIKISIVDIKNKRELAAVEKFKYNNIERAKKN
jgi:hypothetical protein